MKKLFLIWGFLTMASSLFLQSASGDTMRPPLPLDERFHEEKYTDDLSGLLKRRYIRVLTSLSKTNFYLLDGEAFGYEYALLRDYEKFLNSSVAENGLKVTFEFIPVPRNQLGPKLIQGYGDIVAAGLTVNQKGAKIGAFTQPYLSDVDNVVVTYKWGRQPRSLEDLSGLRVLVSPDSVYYKDLVSLNQRLIKSRMDPVLIVEAVEGLETEDMLELVNSGAVDATISRSHTARIWSVAFKNLQICNELRIRRGTKLAWMVRKNNPQLKASLDRFLKNYRRGTLLGNVYFKRYFKDNPCIKNPVCVGLREAKPEYESFFKKYGEKYGFDWMLIMSIAYRESGLEQKKISPSGAVGIMQIRPETAQDKHVAIENIKELENNIHAGVRYLAFLRDNYFSDEMIHLRDRVRFTLAAYNAGPAKIARVRSMADDMGLDPNRWFRNVELAALKMIGQETVRYVSDVNKYYIIYWLEQEEEKARRRKKKKIVENQ